MGKALMVASTSNAFNNNARHNLFGLDAYDVIGEDSAKANASEDMTFSNLKAYCAVIGTSSAFVFRDTGADGNGALAFSGTGLQQDTTNTDALTSGDDFNLVATRVGTNPRYTWIAANVEFGSGHGNMHGAANFGSGTTYDLASTTQYIALGGATQGDGNATEANTQWKQRGYSSLETFQVYVPTNARTTTTTIRTRVNGSNGGLTLTIGAGTTGLLTATGTPDSLSDGDLVNLSIEYGTGTEALRISFVLATFKSSASKSDTFFGCANGHARTASATEHFIPIGGRQTTFTSTTMTETEARIPVGFAATVSNPRVYLSANTYTADATLTVYKNGSSAATLALTASGGAGWYENTVDSFTITDTDTLSFGVTGGSSGSATFITGGLTFAPIAGGSAIGRTPVIAQHYRNMGYS